MKDRCCVSVFASHSLGREGGLDGGGFVSLTLRNGQRELELLGLTHKKKKNFVSSALRGLVPEPSTSAVSWNRTKKFTIVFMTCNRPITCGVALLTVGRAGGVAES